MAVTVIGRLGLAGGRSRGARRRDADRTRSQLLRRITQRLAARAPAARAWVVPVPPIAGAALLGLDHLGAVPAAEQRLRAAYQPSARTPG